MSILQLKEEGKLSFDDTLQKFFPELPYPDVTIRQMLTHTSGLPEYFDLAVKKWDLQKVANNQDVIRLLANEKPPVFFKPGEDVKYSNTSFTLLASIIEKVSGKSWTEYITEHILKPLGMTNSKAYNTRIAGKGPVPGIVYGFLYSDTAQKYVLPESLPQYKGIHGFDDIYGGGGIDMSAGDILKWDRALKNHTLISEATQNEMLSLQSTTNSTSPPISFGYGLTVGKNEFGNFFFSTGHWPGFRSMFIRYTSVDVTAIVLSNNESQSEYIADGLAAILMNKNIEKPYVHKEIQINASTLDKYTGRYLMTKLKQYFMITWPTAIIKKENKLFLHLEGSPDQDDIELKPESATKFFYADGTDRQIEFETDAAGRPVRVWQITWGVRKDVRRAD
jgi:CubicO group peptidase (beta-lactamase class C family)